MRTKIQLLIEDDYMEEFIAALPKDRVSVVDVGLEVNQEKLHQVVQDYKDNPEDFIPYFKSMKNISAWFNAKRT